MNQAEAEQAIEEKRAAEELAKEARRGQDLLKIIDFGLAIRQFLAGPIGKRLTEDSENERNNLAERLILLDPDDTEQRKTIRKHRFRIAVLDHWQELFGAYIQAGDEAEREFQESDQVPTEPAPSE